MTMALTVLDFLLKAPGNLTACEMSLQDSHPKVRPTGQYDSMGPPQHLACASGSLHTTTVSSQDRSHSSHFTDGHTEAQPLRAATQLAGCIMLTASWGMGPLLHLTCRKQVPWAPSRPALQGGAPRASVPPAPASTLKTRPALLAPRSPRGDP